jgi:hypothetical protein
MRRGRRSLVENQGRKSANPIVVLAGLILDLGMSTVSGRGKKLFKGKALNFFENY